MELGPPRSPFRGVWISGLCLWVGLHFEAQICDRVAGGLNALRLLAQKDQSKSSFTNDLIFGEKAKVDITIPPLFHSLFFSFGRLF